SPKYARLGMFLAEYGMALAVLGTLFDEHIKGIGYLWIGLGLLIGTVVGGGMAWWIPMTAGPHRTAVSHSLGALAATLIGISEYVHYHAAALQPDGKPFGGVLMTALGFEVLIGGLTFTGSLMAAGKLMELLPGAPITYKGQNASNIALLAVVIFSFIYLIASPTTWPLFFLMVVLALVFGFLLVVPIAA